MHRAVASVLGPDRFTERTPDREQFTPHVSIAYVSADGEAQPTRRPCAPRLQKLSAQPSTRHRCWNSTGTTACTSERAHTHSDWLSERTERT
jgi:hypothetical protein